MSEHRPHEEEEHLVKPEELPPGVELRPHVYDGIQEYDQRLPNWWLWTLYIFIICYGVFWLVYYQIGMLRSDEERLGMQMRAIAMKQAEELEKLLAELDSEALWLMSRNSEFVSRGRNTYTQQCASCHAADLSSRDGDMQLPGVPLIDHEWIYGGLAGAGPDDAVRPDPMGVFDLIHDGSPDPTTGMQAWGPVLGPRGVAEVTAYVLSYHESPPLDAVPEES